MYLQLMNYSRVDDFTDQSYQRLKLKKQERLRIGT